jgi:hypothetical protein
MSAGLASAQETVRSRAIVHFTFDEENGPAKDSAAAGQTADEGNLVNDPVRVASPFWNQSGKRALQLDAARQQYVEIADGSDLDRPDALTFSLLFVNLQDPGDASYHGLIAKRGVVDGKAYTNYGINFTQQGDTLQVYLSDGSGYKTVQFSAQAAIPVRRLTFLTATYQLADAPAQDGDADVDDVRIQLFSNGEQLKPKAVNGGFVNGNDGWITDVNPAGLVNNLPLSIGRSEAAGEYVSGVVDEFLLFPAALSSDDVKRLFLEVAGPNVRDLIAQDGPAPPKSPAVSSLTPPGIQLGQLTTLTIDGSELGPEPRIVLPLANVRFEIASAEPNRLVVHVSTPADAAPGIYPLWVGTANGISRPLPIVLDRLPQTPLPNSGPESPLAVPAAYFGTLSGSAQPRVYIAGKKGQRLVADVELKRLGGPANPVVEIKSLQGTPIVIAWGHHSLRGDARAEAVLPRDGVYAVELHDLTYNAPGQSPFRLKVGDLRLMDAPFPPVAAPGQVIVEPIGTGFTPTDRWTATVSPAVESRYGLLTLPGTATVDGSVPPILLAQSTEVLESAPTDGQPQVVNAIFADAASTPVGINGRLQKRGERDRYLLTVTPGQKLRFVLQTHSILSSMEGEIALYQHPQGNVLAMTGEQPALTDASLEFTVPADQKQIVVGVRDLLNRADARSFYRLEISPAVQPGFELLLNSPVANLPENGTALMELQVNRFGYDGPIALRLTGDPGATVAPEQIPAGLAGKTLVRLARVGKPAAEKLPLVRLVGTAVGAQPSVERIARLASGAPTPAYAETMALGTSPSGGLSLETGSLPTVLFRGVPIDVAVTVKRQPGTDSAGKPVRFSLVTTEAPRQRVPNNPAAGNFPMVGLAGTLTVDGGVEQTSVKLFAPPEVAESAMDVVLRAEAIVHAYSERSLATVHAPPVRVAIRNAVSPKPDDATLAIVTDAEHRVTGQLQRTAGFTGQVEVTLVGLPGDYQVIPAVVPGDQGAFAVVVKAPKAAQEQPLPNVKLRVTSQGSLLVPEQPVSVKAVPPAK